MGGFASWTVWRFSLLCILVENQLDPGGPGASDDSPGKDPGRSSGVKSEMLSTCVLQNITTTKNSSSLLLFTVRARGTFLLKT